MCSSFITRSRRWRWGLLLDNANLIINATSSPARLAGAERGSRLSQVILHRRCERMRATKHAPRGPPRLLERRHGLAEIVERGARRGGRPARRQRLSFASHSRRCGRLRRESVVRGAAVADVVDVVRVDGHVAPSWAGPLPVGVGALSPGVARRASDASDAGGRLATPADATLRLT